MAQNSHPKRTLTRRQLVILAGIVIAAALLALTLLMPEDRGTYMPYSAFVENLESGHIEQAVINKETIDFALHDNTTPFYTNNPATPDLRERLLLSGAQVSSPADGADIFNMVLDLLFYGVFLGTAAFIVYKLVSYNRSTFKLVHHTGVTFDDIAGMEQPKRELTRVVAALKDPTTHARKGVRPIKGIVLEGPPGNGKTLFARALATEAGVNFIATKGADFQGALMSMGSNKIRMLFRKARRHTPCIVFIDEFDAIGERRNYAGTGIDKENNRIITAMLNEMDGFTSNDRVLVVAATNSYRSLDPALVRPGRFDLKFTVSNPDAATRAELVRLYTERAGRTLAPGLTPKMLVDAFDGLSCAAIETVLNGAASDALAQEDDLITPERIHAAAALADVRLAGGAL